MSTTQAASVPTKTVATPWRGYVWAAVGGVIVVPFVLLFAFNNYSAPDDAAFVRMAFSQVAGGTIAIAMMFTLVAVSVVKRTKAATPVLVVAALLVTQYVAISLSAGADWLLQHLG
ncbi:hypothetical protein [Agromyces allii]|uniref:Uncharacterized protein n=1 Tax=Agromyces allii TaxID=393607 RepID=A0ABP5BCU0_9MICO|nr:hypothetical protein [Agromyces allii]